MQSERWAKVEEAETVYGYRFRAGDDMPNYDVDVVAVKAGYPVGQFQVIFWNIYENEWDEEGYEGRGILSGSLSAGIEAGVKVKIVLDEAVSVMRQMATYREVNPGLPYPVALLKELELTMAKIAPILGVDDGSR